MSRLVPTRVADGSQEGPELVQECHTEGQERAMSAQERSRTAHELPKSSPKEAQERPRAEVVDHIFRRSHLSWKEEGQLAS